MAARFATVSLFKRYDKGGNYIHGGGVEKFCTFLQMVVPELEIFSTDDYTEKADNDWDLAYKLNSWLWNTGKIGPETTVIADGWWFSGLVGKAKRVISVSHGSYLATCLAIEMYPWNDPSIGEFAIKQGEFYTMPGIELVSVSAQAARELKMLYELDSTVIPNAVPLEIYKPDPTIRENDMILHIASPGRKNLEMVDAVLATGKYRIQKLGFAKTGALEEEARLWQRGAILLMPSLFEGSAYGLLEAMACGLVPVVYPTGDAVDLPCDAAIVNDDNSVQAWCHALDIALATRESLFPRQWSEQNRDFSVFAEGWKNYLNL